MGFAIKKGSKHAANQDDFWIIIDGDTKIFGVFDGHGLYGHFCADYVKLNLPKLLLSNTNFKMNIQLALIQSFLEIN